LGIAAGLIYLYLPKRRSLWQEASDVARWSIVPLILLAITSFIVYIPEIKNYFVGDDFTWLRWAATSKISDIPGFFINSNGFFYRPLAKALFTLSYPLLELRPPGYHLIDLFLHLGVTLCAYLIVISLFKKKVPAFLAAFFFLIHPINSESVLWIASTSSLLVSFFYLACFLCYLLWRTSVWRGKVVFYLLTLLTFVLALSSHELAVTLPLMLIFYDVMFHDGVNVTKKISYWLKYIPFVLILIAYFYIRNNIALSHWSGGDYSYNLHNLIFNVPGNLIGYLGILLVSFRFFPFYDTLRESLKQSKIIAAVLLSLALVIVGVIWKTKFRLKKINPEIKKIVVFSVGWLVILLLPFLGLGNIAERHDYPAQLGFFILLAFLIYYLFERIRKINLRFSVVFLALAVSFITGFYILELEQVKNEWYQAGEASNTILLALGTNYSEFADGSTLYFVNVPVRMGRAWLFPVGLDDGLWLIYHNQHLSVKQTGDLAATLNTAKNDPNAYVFVYKDGAIEEVNHSQADSQSNIIK
jgi:hypothetical protein